MQFAIRAKAAFFAKDSGALSRCSSILLFSPADKRRKTRITGAPGDRGAQSAARAPGGMPREDGNRRAREGSSQVERFSAQSENRFYIRNDKSASVLQRACLPACPTHPVPRPRALARSLASLPPPTRPVRALFLSPSEPKPKNAPKFAAATKFRRLPSAQETRVCGFRSSKAHWLRGWAANTPQRERGGTVLYEREKQVLDSVSNMRTEFCRKVHECV